MSADNITLLAFAAECCAAAAPGGHHYWSISPAHWAHSSKPTAACRRQQMGQTDRQVDRVLLHRPCHILCEQCQQSVSNHTDLTHSLFIIKLKSTIVTHSDQALVTNVRYCHCAACTLSTQRLATVPTVMLNKQSIAQFHFESQASETIINYYIWKLASFTNV